MIRFRHLASSALALLLLAAPAQAAVIIDFVQDRFTFNTPDLPGGATPLNFSARLVVSEAAYEEGLAIFATNSYASPTSLTSRIEDIQSFDVTILREDGTPYLINALAEFLRPIPMGATGLTRSFSISSPSPGVLSGIIAFNNTETDYFVSFDGSGRFTGTTNTDRPVPGCNISGVCAFSGQVIVTVPEPAGLAVLALGALAMAGALRRRA